MRTVEIGLKAGSEEFQQITYARYREEGDLWRIVAWRVGLTLFNGARHEGQWYRAAHNRKHRMGPFPATVTSDWLNRQLASDEAKGW